MSGVLVYRVQDAEGRGPWRPGVSRLWVEDREDLEALVPWMMEFGDIRRRAASWEHLGCGCRTVEQVRRWFTEGEYQRLLSLGYIAVTMRVDRILAESETQVVFARATTLREGVEPFDLYIRDRLPEPAAEETMD